MRKIALLAGAAGALMIAGPVLAQEATPPGRNPAPEQTAPAQTMPATPPAESPAAPPAQESVSLTPGMVVRGGDGAEELGKLEGVRVNAQGEQELTVRGADGQLRAVPLGGFQISSSGVNVAWSLEQYLTSPTIAGATPAATPDQASPPAGDTMAPPVPTLPTDPQPSDPAAPTTTTDPMTPDSAAPAPGEDPQA